VSTRLFSPLRRLLLALSLPSCALKRRENSTVLFGVHTERCSLKKILMLAVTKSVATVGMQVEAGFLKAFDCCTV